MKKPAKKAKSKHVRRPAGGRAASPVSRELIVPLGDKVIIRVSAGGEEKKLPSGLYIPETAQEDKSDRGTVVAVGPGKLDEHGRRITPEVKKGDRVLFQWGEKVELKGEKYFVVSESNILAVLND